MSHSYTDIEIPTKGLTDLSAIQIAQIASNRWEAWEESYYDYINLDKAVRTRAVGPSTKEVALCFFQHGSTPLNVGAVIPVYKKEDVKEVTRRVTVDLTEEEVATLRGGGFDPYTPNPITKRVLSAGGDEYGFDFGFQLPRPRKPKALSSPGKLETVYVLRTNTGHSSFYANNRSHYLTTRYSSLAEAKKAAVEIMDKSANGSSNLTGLVVRSFVVRADEAGNETKDWLRSQFLKNQLGRSSPTRWRCLKRGLK